MAYRTTISEWRQPLPILLTFKWSKFYRHVGTDEFWCLAQVWNWITQLYSWWVLFFGIFLWRFYYRGTLMRVLLLITGNNNVSHAIFISLESYDFPNLRNKTILKVNLYLLVSERYLVYMCASQFSKIVHFMTVELLHASK